jgi:NAD(P)H-flavin reductase
MGSYILGEYSNAFTAALSGGTYKRTYNSINDYREKADDKLELVIKYYQQSKAGISKQVHNYVQGDEFYIHGPVGKGLNFNLDNSAGINIIFCGGTGILPFMDMFAYLGRSILSDDYPDYTLFSDEQFNNISDSAQFIIYAHFTTREDSIGIDFLENIEKLFQKQNKGHLFKLNLILTREGGNKMSDKDIVDLFVDLKFSNGRINRLLVCGPPTMNNQFQKLIPELKIKAGLDLGDYDIL